MTDSLPGLSVSCLLRNCSHNIFKKHSFSNSCAHRPFFLPKPLKFVDWNCDCIDLCDRIYPGFNWTDYWHPRSSPAGDDWPVFWSILVDLLSRGHTKVLLAEPAFGLHEQKLGQTPLWVSAVCKWKQPPSDNTQLQPCCYSPVVCLLCVCVQDKSG